MLGLSTVELRASLGSMQHRRRLPYGGYFSVYELPVVSEFWLYE